MGKLFANVAVAKAISVDSIGFGYADPRIEFYFDTAVDLQHGFKARSYVLLSSEQIVF